MLLERVERHQQERAWKAPRNQSVDPDEPVTYAGYFRATPYPHLITRKNSGRPTIIFLAASKKGYGKAGPKRVSGVLYEQNGLSYLARVRVLKNAPESSEEELAGLKMVQPTPLTLQGEIFAVPLSTYQLSGFDFDLYPEIRKANAMQAMKGGSPVQLIVRDQSLRGHHFVVVDHKGGSAVQAVREFLCEPVQVSGEVREYGDLKVFRLKEEDPIRKL